MKARMRGKVSMEPPIRILRPFNSIGSVSGPNDRRLMGWTDFKKGWCIAISLSFIEDFNAKNTFVRGSASSSSVQCLHTIALLSA